MKRTQRDRERERQLRREVAAWLAAQKSKPCMDCRQTYPPYVMDFDHRPGETKRRSLSDMASRSTPSIARLEMEIAKCDLVCANCHRVRTFNRGQHEQGGELPADSSQTSLGIGT